MIDLEFSEPINPATVVAANVYVRDAANAPVAGTLSLRSGNRVIRFTPAAPLSASNAYNYVYYTNGLLDLQGAAVAGSDFYFYMGSGSDTTSPSVTAIVPTAGASGVGVNGSIRLAFSEAVNPISVTSGTVTISAGGTPLGTTMTMATNNLSLTVSPQRPLPAGTLITVTVNGVDDQSGNVVPVTTSSFTTGNAPDITAPTATAMNIVYGDTSVPVNSIFEWAYSEPIDPVTVLAQQSILYDYTAAQLRPGRNADDEHRPAPGDVRPAGQPDAGTAVLRRPRVGRGPCRQRRRIPRGGLHDLDRDRQRRAAGRRRHTSRRDDRACRSTRASA